MPFRWGAASHIGLVREENEDAFCVRPPLGLAVVADGMGGHRGGSVASQIVVDELPALLEQGLETLRTVAPRAVRNVVRRAMGVLNDHVYSESRNGPEVLGMGATVVMVLSHRGRASIANVGDSRAYRLRRRRLVRVTEDHSVVSDLLRNGEIEHHEADDHHAQGQLTQYIGMAEHVVPYLRTFALKTGDRLLLCTDGLTDVLADPVIAGILRREPDSQSACDLLVQAANDAGGHDNVTVVIVEHA